MDLGLLIKYLLDFLRVQYLFWIAVYEVIIFGLKNKLLSLTKKGLNKRVQLRDELEIKLRREGGERQVRIKQRFANASEFHLRVTMIEAILRVKGGEVVDQFSYKASDSIFKDEHKLYFPKDIAPLNLDNEMEYRISGQKLDPKKPSMDFTQVINFSSTRATTITKAVDKTVIIRPEDWEGSA